MASGIHILIYEIEVKMLGVDNTSKQRSDVFFPRHLGISMGPVESSDGL